MQGLVFSLRWT